MDRRYLTLVVLTFINLFNYVDRYILTAVLPSVQSEMHLSDKQAGLLGPAFILVYAVFSPLFGWLGDRGARKAYIAFGVALWSLATGLSGLSSQFATLLLARAFVGIGEAAYGTIAPAIIADEFAADKRSQAMALFFAAIPLGSAFGYLLGGILGAHLGWRPAFFIVGFPGLALALLIFFLRGNDNPSTRTAPSNLPFLSAAALLWRNVTYRWLVIGNTMYTFAIGGISFWMPTYMMRVRGFAQKDAGLWSGVLIAACGLLGTLIGGALARPMARRLRLGHVWLSAIAMLLGGALSLAALSARDERTFLVLLAVAVVALFINTGPINAFLVDIVPAPIRATAVAVAVFSIHVFGDAFSPTLIGWISDASDLSRATMAMCPMFLGAGCVWLYCIRTNSKTVG